MPTNCPNNFFLRLYFIFQKKKKKWRNKINILLRSFLRQPTTEKILVAFITPIHNRRDYFCFYFYNDYLFIRHRSRLGYVVFRELMSWDRALMRDHDAIIRKFPRNKHPLHQRDDKKEHIAISPWYNSGWQWSWPFSSSIRSSVAIAYSRHQLNKIAVDVQLPT